MFSSLSLLSAVVLSLSFFSSVLADSHNSHHPHAFKHTERNHTFSKRFDNARFSYYETGLGACGKTNTDSDFIVALNSAQYTSGSYCFQTINISYNGKSTTAQITDECPGCPYGGLDLSPGLFSFFASEDAGIIYGTWNFADSGSDPSPSPTPTPTPTPTPPPPTTTWIPIPTPTPTPPPPTTTKHTTSTPPPPPPTTSETPSSSWTPPSSSAPPSSSSKPASSEAPLPSAAPSSSPAWSSSAPPPSESSSSSSAAGASPTGGLSQVNQALVQLAAIAAAGGKQQ